MQPYRRVTGVVAPLDRVNVDTDQIIPRAKERPGYSLSVDLEKETIEDEEGVVAHFDVDEFRRHCLLEGLDDIGLTLQHANAIADYEQRRSELLPAAVG